MTMTEAEADDLPSTQSTQLNTPTPAESPRPALPFPQTNSDNPSPEPLDSSSSSSDGNTGRANIQPTWPRPCALNVRRAPAVATFSHSASAEYRLPELGLDICWRPDDNAALFRLYSHIWLVHTRSGDSDKTPTHLAPAGSRVFIIIPPENIVRLEINRDPPEAPFGRSTAAFKFTLSAPPGLVVPKTSTGTYTHRTRKTNNIENKKESGASAARDKLLQLLAGSRIITVLAKVDQKLLPTSQARLLCAALAGDNLVADTHLADTSSLYWGQGGEIIHGEILDPEAKADTAPAYESDLDNGVQLPEYGEPSSRGPGLSAPRGRKRPRVASSSSSRGSESPSGERYIRGPFPPVPIGHPSEARLEARLEARIAGLEARLVAALKSSQAALRSEVLAHLDTTKREILARLDQVENAAIEQAATSVAEMEEDILTRLNDADVSISFDGSVGATLLFHGL